ncbi:MAG: hypothetical protein ACI4JM_07655 [Oscillospiraceae bacterium]
MTAYNRQNFYNMKREAVRNAKEMHKRTAEKNTEVCSETEENNLVENNDNQKNQTNNSTGGLSGIFESLGIKKGSVDSEKIIIIIMIIILAREGADLKLLLALGYILM